MTMAIRCEQHVVDIYNDKNAASQPAYYHTHPQ